MLLVAILLGLWLNSRTANSQKIEHALSQIDQDPRHYVVAGQRTLNITPAQQQQLAQAFLKLYFSPWDDDPMTTARALAKTQQDSQFYLHHLTWQFTDQLFATGQMQKLLDNADLSGFPNVNQPGIVVHTSQARTFPTLLPSYESSAIVGEGYPFDNWINSYIFPGTPVRILQRSKDQLWYFIETPSFYGWTPSENIGFVTPELIAEWKKYPLIVSIKDDTPLLTNNHFAFASLRKGMLYPSSGDQGEQRKVLIPSMDTQGNVQIYTLLADKNDTLPFPIPATAQNIAEMGSHFIGGQYGWGDLYKLRDCSTTTGDILAGFGLWLPRNSLQQSRMGEVISLTGMSNREKLKVIAERGVPFFSIIHFPGHIALYIGTRNGMAYILQDTWSIHTRDILNRESKINISRTVITPLNFGANFSNVKSTLLDRADSISILRPETYTDIPALETKIWQ
jgi:SH3 domain containing protein/putative gamma-D-glutamyl-L-diamino acid endopeptidase-like protein